jgi:cellulose biosynthesis protein BcsQ
VNNFIGSSNKNPCPVCGRTHSDSCRISVEEKLVLCLSEANNHQIKEELNGYIYLGPSESGTWGKWILRTEDWHKERPSGQEYRYPFYDRNDNLIVEEIRQYDSQGGKKTWMTPSGIDTSILTPYRYKDAIAALNHGAPHCIILEGPPKADTAWDLGIPAVAFANGFKAKRDSHWFEGFEDRLILVPDQDVPGIEKVSRMAIAYPMARQFRPWPNSAWWDTEWLPTGGGKDFKDWVEELRSQGQDPTLVVNEAIFQIPKPQKESVSLPDDKPNFNETIDKFEHYINQYTSDLERGWEADNFAFDNKLTQRKISGSRLLSLSQARKDGNGELVVVDALDILERNNEGRKWLIAGTIPLGTTIVIAAQGGSGKTTLLYNFSKCIATGEKWSGFRVKKGKVLIIQADEPECDVAEKLDIAEFHDIPRGAVDFILDWRFTQIRQLKELIKANDYSLIIIDSWTATHAGTGTDLIASTAGDNMYKLRNIAQEFNCTFAIVHHFNKNNDLRDSSTINDNASEIWKLSNWDEKDRIPRDQRILEISKSRAGLGGKYVLQQNSMNYSWSHLGRYEDRENIGDPVMAQILQVLEENLSEKLSVSRIKDRLPHLDMQSVGDTLESLRRIGMCDSEQVVRQHPNGDVSRYRLYFLPQGEQVSTQKQGRHLYAI